MVADGEARRDQESAIIPSFTRLPVSPHVHVRTKGEFQKYPHRAIRKPSCVAFTNSKSPKNLDLGNGGLRSSLVNFKRTLYKQNDFICIAACAAPALYDLFVSRCGKYTRTMLYILMIENGTSQFSDAPPAPMKPGPAATGNEALRPGLHQGYLGPYRSVLFESSEKL